MNRISRMLSVTGLCLLAGITMGAGPAMAATSTDAGASKTGASSHDNRRDRIAGYYDSYRACTLAGRIGERFDRWDDFDCERVGFGFHRRYVLEVSWDRDWRWNDRGHGRPWFDDRDGDFRDGDRDFRDGDRDRGDNDRGNGDRDNGGQGNRNTVDRDRDQGNRATGDNRDDCATGDNQDDRTSGDRDDRPKSDRDDRPKSDRDDCATDDKQDDRGGKNDRQVNRDTRGSKA